MKRYFLSLAFMLSLGISVQAMSYYEARQHALFLADKMAFELNLNEEQYEAIYETNLDYFMQIESYDDLYGVYWQRRNLDLQYILYNWQYTQFCNASYFYRPLYYNGGYIHFSLYSRYPRRDYFYFGEPRFYYSYRGSHSWYNNNNRSWYYGRSFGNGNTSRSYNGMRDWYNNGTWVRGNATQSPSRREYYDDTYNRGSFGGRSYNNTNRYNSFGNSYNRSTTYNSNNRFDANSSYNRNQYNQGSNFSARSNYNSSRIYQNSSFGGSSPSRRTETSSFGGTTNNNMRTNTGSTSNFNSRTNTQSSFGGGAFSPFRR